MSTTARLEIEYVEASELEQFPGNARRGIVSEIKDSMIKNGVYQAITVQKSTNRIIAGNHRWIAMTELHAEDPEKWESKVPVVYRDVNDNVARRMNVVDNKTSDDASTDVDALIEQLQQIQEEQGDLEGSGYDNGEFEDLLRNIEAEDLDDLAAEYGEPNDEDLWPAFTVKLPPMVHRRLEMTLDTYDGDRAAQIATLLDVINGTDGEG